MFSVTAILLARAIHVMAGVVWAGAVAIMAIAIVPILLRHGSDGAGKWIGMVARRAGMVSGPSALLTVLSGIYLFATLHANDDTAGGWVLKTGAAAALLSLAVGLLVGRPAGTKLAKIQESLATGGENAAPETIGQMAALRSRAVLSAHTAFGLLALSVLAMATFRYAQALAG